MWESRIKRANYLAAQDPAASDLLSFYAKLLGVQQEIYENLRQRQDGQSSGSVEQDLKV
jgi:formate dehydrogenase maturation protein FdhE